MQVFFARWASGRAVKYRSLTWAEYRKFSHQISYDCPAAVFNDVYRAVLLDGPELDGELIFAAPAGLVEWVAHSLLDSNPFSGQYGDVKRALDTKRAELASDWLLSAKAVMAGLFKYTFEEIDRWDAETFFERLAAAEFVSGRQIEPGDPNRKKGKRDRPKKQLTAAQQEVQERVRQRGDPRMPMPAEENVNDPTVESRPASRKRPMTPAQEMVAERAGRVRR